MLSVRKTREAQRCGVGPFIKPCVDFGVLRQAGEAESIPGSVAPVPGLPSEHPPLRSILAEYS